MAYGVQSTGFVSKTQAEIVEDINEQAVGTEFFGPEWPTTPDSVFGNLVQIIAAAIKDSGWDLAESVYNQYNRDKAEGKNLDDLAALIGLTRLQASGSTGLLLFQGSAGSVVPLSTPVADNDSRYVLTTSELTYNRTACYQTRISVTSLLDSTTYTVSVEGTNFNYTSGTGATVTEIVLGLASAIGTQTTYTATTEDNDETLVVTYNSLNNVMLVAVSSELSIFQIGMLVNAQAEETGDLSFPADTLTELSPVPVGTVSVTNPQAFSEGRDEETDEELRLRMAQRESSTGTATKPSIESSISELTGVTSVLVKENTSLVTDSEGVPPKAYETFVTGGDEDEIADVIWTTKPAGILTYGDITKVIVDANGDEQTVQFSRPSESYATVIVTYEIYTEEDFPVDGETTMAQTVVDYGNSLGVGEDIIPQRFNAQMFRAVDGLLSVVTQIGISNDPNTPPVSYTTDPIPVGDSETVDFDLTRVTVSV